MCNYDFVQLTAVTDPQKEEEYLSQCTADLKEKENEEGREGMMTRKDVAFWNFQKEKHILGVSCSWRSPLRRL